jgi:3-phenylpropionate/trans-cinnamate dioxygenase ferredoxin reductase subunit
LDHSGTDRHIVIVGAGHAGGRAAEALRGSGFGGRVTLIGSERHPPYERPPLSKELLDGAIPVEKTHIRPASFYEEAGIALRLGMTVAGIDARARRLALADGTSEAYDTLLLTTGARARRLGIPGGEGPHVYYLRDIDDTLALRERLAEGVRLVVIGAGFIGLEVAAVARKRGAAVTVLELAPYPLGRVLAPEIGNFFAELHQRKGAVVRTGVGVESLDDTGGEVRIKLRDGEVLTADLVAVGIGAVPNAELAAEAGLEVRDGVVVDQYGRSSDPTIYAAGDVTRFFNPLLGRHIRLEAWQNAQNQAIAVAKIIAGGTEPFAEVPWFWTDQYDVNLQIAGAPERWDRLVWRGTPADAAFTVFYLLDGRPVAANTINNGRDMRFAKLLIARGQPVDAALLGDKSVKLQDLCR